jgi:hypothetical protein
MILPSTSRMWTECPSDCSTLEYCRSGSAEMGPTSPAPVARPSLCSGDECGNDCDPRDQARGPPSKPSDSRLAGGMPRLGETDCERRRSAPLGMNLDISCLSCACPTSSFRIFFKSSSPLDSIPAGTPMPVHPQTDPAAASPLALLRDGSSELERPVLSPFPRQIRRQMEQKLRASRSSGSPAAISLTETG